MTFEVWLSYAGTVLVLMSTPGPSQLLMLSNSINHGFGKSAYTAAGDLTANFLQMVVASVGLASVIASSQTAFAVIKWAGVGYLVFLGLKLLLKDEAATHGATGEHRSRSALYWQGFVTSAANPKAVVFFAALFPQFVDPGDPLFGQFVVLSATYLLIDAGFLCGYGKFADGVSARLMPAARQQLNRFSGALLIGAAILLGAKDMAPRTE